MTSPRMWTRHGRHPAPARPDAEAIRWLTYTAGATRHLIDDTCECQDIRYGLYAFGGRRFIRRTIKRTGKVYYSDLMICREADETWQRLLEGKAR